jgi:hypothetical protein
MRLILGLLACVCLGQWSQALATDPPAAAPAAVQPGQSPPSTSAPSPATASSATNTAATSATPTKELSDADDQKLRAQGFKKEVRNGTTYYCRRETILGSHFEQKSCRTAARIAEERQNAKDITERAQVETMNTSGK